MSVLPRVNLIRKSHKNKQNTAAELFGTIVIVSSEVDNFKIEQKLVPVCVYADACAPALEVKARAHETKIDGLGLYSSAYFIRRDINLGCSRVK